MRAPLIPPGFWSPPWPGGIFFHGQAPLAEYGQFGRPDIIDDAEAIRALDPADLSVLLYSGRLQRDEHILRLEAMMAACFQ